MEPVRLALLLCGDLQGRAKERNGGYFDIYDRYLRAAQGTKPFLLDGYDVVRDEYPVDEDSYQAFILTGSPASAYDTVPWIDKLVAYVARLANTKPHIKLIGFCFGHQLIARALGASCVPNPSGWEIAPTPITLTPLGTYLFNPATDPSLLYLQQMHRDHVPSLPEHAHLLALTPHTPIQSFLLFSPPSSPLPSPLLPTSTLPPIHILAIQGHPEFTEPIVSSIIEQRAEKGVFEPAIQADAERRRFWKNDGLSLVGRVVWEVIVPTPAPTPAAEEETGEGATD